MHKSRLWSVANIDYVRDFIVFIDDIVVCCRATTQWEIRVHEDEHKDPGPGLRPTEPAASMQHVMVNSMKHMRRCGLVVVVGII